MNIFDNAPNISNSKIGLTNNQLKIIAMISMLIDHIGVQLFPNILILRIIGRLAYPIFAYMIAEGCFYTKNKLKYFLSVSVLGIACQLVFYFFMGSLYQGILITFAFSILTIFAIDYFINKKNFLSFLVVLITILAVCFVTIFMPIIYRDIGFEIDYTALGVLLPVAIYYSKHKVLKIFFVALICFFLSFIYEDFQFYSLLSLPLLLLYNGERGTAKLKYMFYIFYPVHLIIIYFIGLLLW